MYVIKTVYCLPWLPFINKCGVEVKHFIIPSLSSSSPVLLFATKTIKTMLLCIIFTLHLEGSAMLDFVQRMVSWVELFLFHRHAHESMDKHWYHEIYSHTDLPTLGIYLIAHHSIPRQEMMHDQWFCYFVQHYKTVYQLPHVGCRWLAWFLTFCHFPPQVIVLVQKSLFNLICDFVCFDLSTSLWNVAWIELTHSVSGSNGTVFWQTRLCTVVNSEFSSTIQRLITMSASNGGPTAASTEERGETVSWIAIFLLAIYSFIYNLPTVDPDWGGPAYLTVQPPSSLQRYMQGSPSGFVKMSILEVLLFSSLSVTYSSYSGPSSSHWILMLQSSHSEGVPSHVPPKSSGKQDPKVFPPLGGP